jgi:hypothetical protein
VDFMVRGGSSPLGRRDLVGELAQAVEAGDLAVKTVNNALGTLVCLDDAVDDGLIATNPYLSSSYPGGAVDLSHFTSSASCWPRRPCLRPLGSDLRAGPCTTLHPVAPTIERCGAWSLTSHDDWRSCGQAGWDSRS